MVHAMNIKFSDDWVSLSRDINKCPCCKGQIQVKVKEFKEEKLKKSVIPHQFSIHIHAGGQLYHLLVIEKQKNKRKKKK